MDKERGVAQVRRIEPLSFSLGCLEGCKENEDSSLSFISPAAKNSPLCTNSLNRRKPKLRAERDGVRKSWDPSVKEDGSQEFWASIREPYDFIMGTNLIPDSYEMDYKDQLSSSGTELELLWDPDDVSPSYVWSFSEFLDQYNELYEWLIQIQLKLYASSTPHDKQLRIAQQEELMRRSYRRKLFLDQSEKVALTYPSSAEEVKWRVNYLNNKWEQLQTTLNTARFGPREENDIELDLAQEEYILRGWLNTMEEQIQPITCKLPRGCSLHALQERYKDNQILLKDIKAHGPILKSLFRQYERSVTPPAGSDVVPSSDSPTLKCSPEEGKDSVDSASLDTTKEEEEEAPVKREAKEEFKSVPRKTKALEKRWHQVYLRSLEWHYYLEGVIADYKDQRSTCSSDCEDEEPVSKCRRLSGSSFSSCSSTAQFSRRRKKSCQAGWSDYEVNSSDAGSYIEDDYLTNSVGQLKACKVSVHEEGLNRTVKGALSKKKLSVVINSTELVGSIDQMETEGRIVSKDVPVKELEEKKEEGEDSLRRKNQRRNPSRKSYLTEVNRPSPNCGTFDYKHNDTDSDNNNNGDFDNSVSSKCGSAKRNRECQTLPVNLRKKLDSVEDDEVDQEELQRIIDHAILDQDWLNSNITSESEGSVIEDNADDVRPEESFLRQESMESESEEEEEEEVENNSAKEGKKSNDESPVKKPSSESSSLCKRESIHRLISGAEELVREPLKHPTIVTPRSQLKPLPFGIVEDSKQHRIKQWLSSQTDKNLSPNAHIIGSAMQDSCDASGELTTGESDVESIGSGGGFDTSLATQKGSGDLNLSSENTPTVEGLPSLASDNSDKVIRRVKRGQFKDHRPWSLGDHNLLMDDGVKELKGAEGAAVVKNAFSSSESALHLIPSYSNQSQPKNLSNSQDDLKRSSDQMSNVSPTHDAVQKGRVSSSPPSSTNVPPSQKQAQNNSSDTPGSLRRRRTKYRRRSNNLLYRRGDFGFDESGLFGKLKDSKAFSYSPYNHPLTKSMSSDSDCVLEPSAGHRSYSFSGSAGKTGTVMTSSTEKGLSDFSSTSKGPPSPAKTKEEEETPALIPTIKLPSSDPASPVSSLKRAPPASDQEASTHQEDISSLSEQAWDPYQEYKYLSEPYSEDLDLDAERKLLNFGDDYRKYIDSDGSSHWGIPFRKRRSPLQQQQQQHQHQQLRRLRTHSAYRSLDSDSDLDDLHHVIGESKSQLVAMENVFDKFSSQSSLGLDFGEIIATARRNVKCLQDIWKHLSKETPDLQSEIGDVQGILERWEALQTKALEQQRQSTQLRQLQRQVKSLRLSLENILRQCSSIANPLAIESPSQFPSKLEEVKGLLSETETLRQDLSNLNILVHRFSSETGFAATPLKDEMAELYRMWDETHRRVSGEFSRLQNAELCWHLWEEQKANLSEALKQDFNTLKVIDAAIDNGKLTDSVTASVRDVAKLLNERRNAPNGSKAKILLSSESAETKLMELKNKTEAKEDRLSDSGTSGYESCSSDDLSERERRLAYLRRLARDLEATLVPGSKAWEDINNTLAQAEKELKELQDHCRSLIHRTTEALDPSVKHSRFHTNNKRRNISREGKNCRVTRSERRGKNGGSRKEWIWRVARAAVPFQAALLLLLCVTCLLEPSCCDSVNTFNLSFGPQLRFVPGSPPV